MSKDMYYSSDGRNTYNLFKVQPFFSFKDEDKYVIFYVIRKYEKWMFLQIVCTVFPVVGAVCTYIRLMFLFSRVSSYNGGLRSLCKNLCVLCFFRLPSIFLLQQCTFFHKVLLMNLAVSPAKVQIFRILINSLS